MNRPPETIPEAIPETFMAAAASALASAGDSMTTVLVELLSDGFAQPPAPTLASDGPLVTAYHPASRAIGEAVLAEGGNAFDAFIATAIAENIEAEGASSLAGSMAALVFTAADGIVSYLDAGFSDPLDPQAGWSPDHPERGRAILVPGAPAGLWALWERHGSLDWPRLVAPALALAHGGFPVVPMMAKMIHARADVLKASTTGQAYLHRGRSRRIGETIVLPEAAAFLEGFAAHGAAHVYAGDWGSRFLAAAAAEGSGLGADDLAAYRPA